ncbi:MAG: HAMP domain-containing histidine kinase [Bacteroidales bacterium]|nr:HAMP domain-containing histidine kinase [Lachnoclostridium sp.]MCM1382908.1 HAMP domain-containing histidine kinase [Lachnoclostridium sp.]MCM1465914.1 HAMP domain-containing histidine kinase [Bacteroidales bacterium]
MAALLGSVKDKYPQTPEEEWVELLNNGAKQEEGKLLLEKYGIFQNDFASITQKKLQSRLLIGFNVLFIGLGTAIILIFVNYYRNRVRNMEKLASYIRRVEQGEYVLPMLENSEDELTSLKNELYKVTVMLKEAALASQNQKKALADSVSDISHQIKTPITSAMVLLDNVSESEGMDEATKKKFLTEITRQLSHINWLVATLLKLSRLDAGVVEFVNKPFCLDKLVDEVLEKLELMAELKQISFERERNADTYIEGDFQWLSEAAANIIKNAIEHSPEGGKIMLRVQDNAVYTALSIKDFGEGMDEEEQKHIFERFYRSKNAAKDSIGIGLSLAKEIIEQQNGSLTVESQKGRGTEFFIKFLKI